MAEMITARMRSAHSRFEKLLGAEDIKGKTVKISGSLQYPQAPIQSQKRWLLNYKARKDIAMNLVFNLVTQQYSVANTLTAKEAKADSSSMKAMAILTMVFPPGTSIASVFSLDFISSAKWTDYVAITLPLTVGVVITWCIFTTYPLMIWIKELPRRCILGEHQVEDSNVWRKEGVGSLNEKDGALRHLECI